MSDDRGGVGLLSGCVVTLTCSVVVHIVSALQAVVCGELEFAWDCSCTGGSDFYTRCCPLGCTA